MWIYIGIILGIAAVAYGIYKQKKKEDKEAEVNKQTLNDRGICDVCGAKPKNLHDHKRRNRCKAVIARKNKVRL